MRLPLLRAWGGTLGHVEQKYPRLGLGVNFAKKEETARLNSLFTKEELRGLMGNKNYYSAGTALSVAAAFIDESSAS